MPRWPRKINRNWGSIFSNQRNSFLRSLGFELPFILSGHQNTDEPPKCVYRKSRRLALARCGVHILPILVSITVICLNLVHSYLGRTLPGSIPEPSDNIALLQVAAKAHELFIVASAVTVAMEVIRQELVSGEGVPLGMLVGGFMCTGLSYFWSAELFGALKATCSWASRIRIFAILVTAGLLAALAGPASAVLLIPKEQSWNAGGTSIFVPSSSDLLWPMVFNSSTRESNVLCTQDSLLQHGLCQNGGYVPLTNGRDVLDIFGRADYPRGSRQNLTTNMIFGPKGIDIANNFELIRGFRYSGNFRGYACETAIVGLRAVEAMYQKTILQDWTREVMSIPWDPHGRRSKFLEYKYYRSLTATTASRIPAVRVSCTPAQNISHTGRKIDFPFLDPNGCSKHSQRVRSHIVDELADPPSSEVRATWIDPDADLGAVSGLVLVQLPSSETANSTGAVGCSIDARWADGTIITSDLRSFSTSSNINVNFKAPDNLDPALHGPPTAIGQAEYSEFRPVLMNPSSTRITLGHDWLYDQSISTNGSREESSGWTQRNLNTFLQSLSLFNDLSGALPSPVGSWNSDTPGTVNRTVALEWIFTLLITDALSRTGSDQVLKSTGPISSWSIRGYERAPNFQTELLNGGDALTRPDDATPITQERVAITIGGYSYRASALTDYLSIALLLIHMLMAVSHIVYLMSTGKSSSAWESMSELLVLAQNSRPAPTALRNANVGVKRLKTYSRIARVYAVKPCEEDEDEPEINSNVELVFDETERDVFSETTFRPAKSDHHASSRGPSKRSPRSKPVRRGREARTSLAHSHCGCENCGVNGQGGCIMVELVDVLPDVKYGHAQNRRRKRTPFDSHS